jgi:hypothetical protein
MSPIAVWFLTRVIVCALIIYQLFQPFTMVDVILYGFAWYCLSTDPPTNDDDTTNGAAGDA